MEFEIGDVEPSDLVTVLALNESEVPHLGDVDLDRMQWFAAHAAYFRVAKTSGQLAAFLIGMRAGTSYASPNYRWFCEHYDDFAYIDRVAVRESARRHGLASRLYTDFAANLPDAIDIMTCEVNIRPLNEESMRFHTRLGFQRVGSLTSDNGAKEVALLAKNLRLSG